jgi:hypothetical protein
VLTVGMVNAHEEHWGRVPCMVIRYGVSWESKRSPIVGGNREARGKVRS